MEFRVLGPLEVRCAEEVVAVGSRMERALLAALLAHANTVVPTPRLAEALWGDRPPPSERNSLQTYVARLRRRLGRDAADLIVTHPPGYAINIDRGCVDALRFEDLVRQARAVRRENPVEALLRLDEGRGLWRGPAFAEFATDELIRGEAGRLDELRQAALDERVDLLLDLGRVPEAVAELEASVATEPWRERPQAQLMVALARAGRQVEALRVYRRYRDRLAEEVGLEPSAALQELEGQVLRQMPGFVPEHQGLPRGGNLPVPPASLVGRDHDLAELTAALGRCRAVSLVGAGGVGKTRLALEAAVRVAGAFRDGAWLVELAAVASGEAVPHVVAAALGAQPRQAQSLEDALADFLRSRRLLLVLDNCEHVLEAAARLVAGLVPRCPGLVVLATSRERLAVDFEQVWPVPPLPVPGRAAHDAKTVAASPAAALFLERARAARPDFNLDGDNATSVAAICRGLDGLPLALELAAARMQALTAADLSERLSDRFAVLTGGSRADHARHHTLQAVVDWSYGLLDERERRVFERLSVFAGGFTLEDAAAVCSAPSIPADQVVPLVAGLVDKSMVVGPRGTGVGRYAMLETLRRYGAERLAARGEDGGTHRRHAQRFLALAEDADVGIAGPVERRSVERLQAEVDNLREAHAWCRRQGDADRALRLSLALHRFAWRQIHDEIPTWAAAAVEMPAARGHGLLPAAHGAAGLGPCRRGDLSGAIRHAEAGLAASAGRDDPARVLPLELLADAWSFSGRLDEAHDAYGEAARLARLAGDEAAVAYHLAGQALARAYQGDLDAALGLAEQIRLIGQATGNPTVRAWALYTEGESLLDGDPHRALGLLEESLELAVAAGNLFLAGVAMLSATSLRGRHGEPFSALRSYRQAIEHWHRHGNWTQQWITLRNLVPLLGRAGANEPAVVVYGATTTSPTAPPTFGPEAQRLEAVVSTLSRRLDPPTFEAAVRRGTTMTDDAVVAYAAQAINDLLEAATTDQS